MAEIGQFKTLDNTNTFLALTSNYFINRYGSYDNNIFHQLLDAWEKII